MLTRTGVWEKMGRRPEKSRTRPHATPVGDDPFPDTRTEILEEAAAGNWRPFLEEYLRPCWREVVIACHTRRLPIPDAEDLYQELMVRIIREAPFGRGVQHILAEQQLDPHVRANLPGRYLMYRKLPLESARFRTYLKRTIQNVLLETMRKQKRRPEQLDSDDWKVLEPWIEQSISASLDRRWMSTCLTEAALRLRSESVSARTRGRRRLFDVLYLSTVEGLPAEKIAGHYGIHRTTIADLLTRARDRLVELMHEVTGIAEPSELKELMAANVSELKEALTHVRQDFQEGRRRDAPK